MTIGSEVSPPWLLNVLLAEDDTEDSVMGSDWHQEAILEARSVLLTQAEARAGAGETPWYVSSQVTIIVNLPRRDSPWRPKPDLFVVVGQPATHRTSYDTRRDGPMPQFVLEVASESTWSSTLPSGSFPREFGRGASARAVGSHGSPRLIIKVCLDGVATSSGSIFGSTGR